MASKYTKQSDGRYRTSVFTGKYKDDGSPIKVYLSARTIKELDAKVMETKQKLADQINLVDEHITYKRYSEKWLTTFKSNKGIRTVEMYDRIIRVHSELLQDKELKDIRRVHIQDQINANKDHPRTCEQMLLTFKQIFDSAVKDDIIRKSPCTDIELPRHIKQEKRSFTQEERNAIKAADLNVRQRAFVSVLLGTGMRPAEAYALTWSDIDFKKHEITVNKSITFENNKPIVVYPKTNAGIRTIQAPTWLFKALLEYRHTTDTLIVFAGENGDYRTKQAYARAWNYIKVKIDRELGYDSDIVQYMFRHSYCTSLYYSGVSLKEAQRLLGHSSYEMIMSVYAHLDATKENTAQKINSIAF